MHSLLAWFRRKNAPFMSAHTSSKKIHKSTGETLNLWSCFIHALILCFQSYWCVHKFIKTEHIARNRKKNCKKLDNRAESVNEDLSIFSALIFLTFNDESSKSGIFLKQQRFSERFCLSNLCSSFNDSSEHK